MRDSRLSKLVNHDPLNCQRILKSGGNCEEPAEYLAIRYKPLDPVRLCRSCAATSLDGIGYLYKEVRPLSHWELTELAIKSAGIGGLS